MKDASKIHDQKYKYAKATGIPGWGGADRISKLPQTLDERFFAFTETPSSGKLLELGCGAGNLSIILSEKGFDVFGVDFSETAIEWAKDNAKASSQTIDFKVADVTDLSCFEDESFDVLYDGNCLHCLIGDKRAAAFAEWRRVLKSNGLLFISSLCASSNKRAFPKEFDSTSRILTEAGMPYRFIPTPEIIKSELSAAGFRIANTAVRDGSPFGHINIHAYLAD